MTSQFVRAIIGNRLKPEALYVSNVLPRFEVAEPKLDGHRLTIIKDGEGELYAIGRKTKINLIEKVRACLCEEDNRCLDSLENFTAVDGEIYSPGKSSNIVTHHLAEGKPLDFTSWAVLSAPGSRGLVILEKDFDWHINKLCDLGLDTLNHSIPKEKYIGIEDKQAFCKEFGYEGFVLKRKPLSGWYKLKFFKSMDLVVIGFDTGDGRLSGTLGALRLGRFDPEKKRVVPYCKVGTGFSDVVRKEIWSKREEYLNEAVEIRYDSIQVNGPRFPRFLRFRPDKPIEECTLD